MIAIYQIICLVNNRCYIGSAVNVKIREREHFSDLKLNKHPNRHLQRAYNKYGFEKFVFKILEVVDGKDILVEREQFYLDTILYAQDFIKRLNSKFKRLGFNLSPTAYSTLGFRFNKKQKKNISKSKKGIKTGEQSLETILKKSGKNHWTTRSKLSNKSIIKIKKTLAKYYKENISVNKGKKKSKKTKDKISSKLMIPVMQYDKNGNFIKEWRGASEAVRKLKIPDKINRCCKGKQKTAGGFIWKYKNKIL